MEPTHSCLKFVWCKLCLNAYWEWQKKQNTFLPQQSIHPTKKSSFLPIGLCRNDSCFSNSPTSKRFVLSFPPVSRNRLIPNPRSDSYFSHPLRFSFLVIFFSYPTSCWAEFAHGRFDPVYLQLCLITLINQQPSEIVSTFSYLRGTWQIYIYVFLP